MAKSFCMASKIPQTNSLHRLLSRAILRVLPFFFKTQKSLDDKKKIQERGFKK